MPKMNQSCRVFLTGDFVPGTPSSSESLTPGSPATLNACYKIVEGDITYQFIFWNVDATVTPPQGANPEQTVTFNAPSDDSTFNATAWYIEDIGGPPGGDVFAFSLNQDQELPNSPIGTITPASAQTGPNTFSTTDPVMVGAPPLIEGYGRFTEWLPWFENNVSITGPVLNVAAGGSIAAVAFYGIPVPDPCQDAREALENFTPEGYPTLADAKKAFAELKAQLLACEKQYGE
jgi:hypothetical protein